MTPKIVFSLEGDLFCWPFWSCTRFDDPYNVATVALQPQQVAIKLEDALVVAFNIPCLMT
jgi:hypothetical protein